MTSRTVLLHRYDLEPDARPCMQTIVGELDDAKRMLLSALMKLKAMDPRLRSCRSCR